MSAPNEEKWLEWRRQGITATDVADASAGTYGGMYAVVAKKQGKLPPVEKTPQMQRGLDWEQPVADMVHIGTGYYVVGEQSWWQHVNDPRLRATFDGLLATRVAEDGTAELDDVVAVFECKTVDVNVRPNRDRWHSQVQWQMLVSGINRALIAEVRIDDATGQFVSMRLDWVEADEFVQQDLLELAEEMFGHMEAGTLPEPSSPSALPVAREVNRVADPDADAVDLTALADDLRDRVGLKEGIKIMEDDLAVIDARIIAAMGDATKGGASGYKVSYGLPAKTLTAEREVELLETHPEYGMTVLDRARVKANDEKLYESFRTRAGARSLRVTAPKG